VNRIFVLYWRCSLIRVSVIRGSTVILAVVKWWHSRLRHCATSGKVRGSIPNGVIVCKFWEPRLSGSLIASPGL
jgi:hypothetical protein